MNTYLLKGGKDGGLQRKQEYINSRKARERASLLYGIIRTGALVNPYFRSWNPFCD